MNAKQTLNVVFISICCIICMTLLYKVAIQKYIIAIQRKNINMIYTNRVLSLKSYLRCLDNLECADNPIRNLIASDLKSDLAFLRVAYRDDKSSFTKQAEKTLMDMKHFEASISP